MLIESSVEKRRKKKYLQNKRHIIRLQISTSSPAVFELSSLTYEGNRNVLLYKAVVLPH